MEQIESIQRMKSWARTTKRQDKSIGLVPTMGYLHEGHFSLVRQSLKDCDKTVVSIFINPKQFGPTEDLDRYPSDFARDKSKLQALGVDVLFSPSKTEIYPSSFKTHVEVEKITNHLCGKSRPGFFRGVGTVVLKLLNIVSPDKAFFGEKDWQQLKVIETLVKDLNLDTEIIPMPIVRETDDVAMSSRNSYLDPNERQSARSLHRALKTAKDLIIRGETSCAKIRNTIQDILQQEPGLKVDYISLCDPDNFTEIQHIEGDILIALAVFVGKARLIDNFFIRGNHHATNHVDRQTA